MSIRAAVKNMNRVNISGCVLIIAAFFLSSCGSSDSESLVMADDDPNIPTMPGKLNATVYSSTEIELFWTPSVDNGWVMGYDIYRDSELIVERLDANSYFDPELESLKSYQYTIVAVDDDDNQGQAAAVRVTTLHGPALPTINRANYVALLTQVFETIVGDSYNKPLMRLESMALDESNGISELITQVWNKSYNCENKGSGNSQRRDGFPGDSSLAMQFVNCTLGGKLYHGEMKGNGNSITSTGISITDSDNSTLSFSGSAIRERGSREPWGGAEAWAATGVNITKDSARLIGNSRKE